MSKNIKKQNLLIGLLVMACLFSENSDIAQAKSVNETDFDTDCNQDEKHAQEILNDSQLLKEGDYYVKVNKAGEVVTSLSIPTTTTSEAPNTLEITLDSFGDGVADTYKLTSNEALEYVKIELSSDIYALLYRGTYNSDIAGGYTGWHLEIQKEWLGLTSPNIFERENKYTLCYGDSEIILRRNDADTEFTIEIKGSLATSVRNQKKVPLFVRSIYKNEYNGEFDMPKISLSQEQGTLIFKDYVILDDGIYVNYELKNSEGNVIDLKEATQIKRKLKDETSYTTVKSLAFKIEDKGDYEYVITFKDKEYVAEIEAKGVSEVLLEKTGNTKVINGETHLEYASENVDFSNSTMYEFGVNIQEILVNTENLYFPQSKEGNYIYYLRRGQTWYKFSIYFTRDEILAPSLRSLFLEEKQEGIFFEFYLKDTGNNDTYVDKYNLRVFNKDNELILEDTKEGTFKKDTLYTFELDREKFLKGETYYYTLKLENSAKTFESEKQEFKTRPGNVTGIEIEKLETNKIKLTFEKGEGSTETQVFNSKREPVFNSDLTSFEYSLSSDDDFLYFVSKKDDMQAFEEIEVEVGSYYEKVIHIVLPTIETKEAFDITETEATLKGSLEDKGNSDNVSLYFNYGKESGIYDTTIETDESFELKIDNLEPETTYYFRAKACNEKGCSFGEELSFKTEIQVNAPSLRNTFFEEEKDSALVSFEIKNTGHSTVDVSKVVLTLFNAKNKLILEDTKQGSFEKDTFYTFELDKNKLLKGETYYYTLKLANSAKTFESEKQEFQTRPGNVSEIEIEKLDTNKIKLTFEKGEGSTETQVLNSKKELIFNSSLTSFEYNLTASDDFLYFLAKKENTEAFDEIEVEVGSYYERIETNVFNSDANDYPLRVNGGEGWKTLVEDVQKGEYLNFSLYYHNASENTAKNAKAILSLKQGKEDEYTIESKLMADGFETYTSSVKVNLKEAGNISLDNELSWYHDFDGEGYTIDDMDVDVLNNTITFNLGDIKPGYAPNDGHLIFYAKAEEEALGLFNANKEDKSLRVNTGSGWDTSAINVSDNLSLSFYYHNASENTAKNAKAILSLKQGKEDEYTIESKLMADGFETYTSSVKVNLEKAGSINLDDSLTWYHDFDGEGYTIDDMDVDVSNNTITFNLGDIKPGYAPNDGYLTFNAQVELEQGEEEIIINAPSLRSTFFEEEKERALVSFEIKNTGHSTVDVSKVVLTLFNAKNKLILEDTKQGSFEKDTFYTFELDKNKLLKGETYYYTLKLANSAKTFESEKQEFQTRPGNVSEIEIEKLDTNKIKLTFEKGEGSTETQVLNSKKELIFNSSLTSFEYNLTASDDFLYFLAKKENTEAFDEIEVEVGSYYERIETNVFNSDANDYPLRVNGGEGWKTLVEDVQKGEYLNFSLYYHNASENTAKNAKAILSLKQGKEDEYTIESKLMADGFETYTSSVKVNLKEAGNISLDNELSWYHDFDGEGYTIDDMDVDVLNNTITFNLGDIKPGYAPNDGYIIFYALTEGEEKKEEEDSGSTGGSNEELSLFNTNEGDHPLRVNTGSGWETSATNVSDNLSLSFYYHNASENTAKNAKAILSLKQDKEDEYTIEAKLMADGFETYTSSVKVNLKEAGEISLDEALTWYHNFDGEDYTIDDVDVDVLENTITFNLGDIEPGYAPNDGYVIFTGQIDVEEKETEEAGLFNIDERDYPLRVSTGSSWGTSATNVSDNLSLSFYYHNASENTAKNAKAILSLKQDKEDEYTIEAKLMADGFETYTSSVKVNLKEAGEISLDEALTWYHNFDGENYTIDDVDVDVLENTITFNLGDIEPGYAPNDGYVIFYVSVIE
ncbi:MAG: fibronectin type III domain-containing protein [Minisyncoccales bacterium]